MWSPSLRGAFGRLVSYPQPPTPTEKCLTFFYKLYGPNAGALNVKLIDGLGYEIILWTRSGAHGNEWHEAQCPVPQQLTTFQLTFEAVRSGLDGQVAIDDVAFVDRVCTIPRKCSFEGQKCGYSTVKWLHRSYYMMVNTDADVFPTGTTAVLTSPVRPGTTKPECVSFWYHMGGPNPGYFTVYLKLEKGERVPIFSESLGQGDDWRHGNSNISNGLVDWQIVFEGIKGTSGFVALDDIEYTVGFDCATKVTQPTSKKPDNAGGIAASVIVVLLLIGTLVALLVFYLQTRPELEASSGATGFSNEGYVPDSTVSAGVNEREE
ncbi:hypothetical protein GOODEAATRI_022527 [Goodea atripinnis]|uniref:MAM domain-containing protein n=1 Tax=Goodea atripinnis TaxID=208336 RepID=A0ABV0NX73_9TELE